MAVKVQVAVEPYVKKYIEYYDGASPIIISTEKPLSFCLFNLFETPTHVFYGKQAIRPAAETIEVILPSNYSRTNKVVITELSTKMFNKMVKQMMQNELFGFLDNWCIGLEMTGKAGKVQIKIGIERWCQKYGINEMVWPYQTIVKAYYRFRQQHPKNIKKTFTI